jgi:hypothetical protein
MTLDMTVTRLPSFVLLLPGYLPDISDFRWSETLWDGSLFTTIHSAAQNPMASRVSHAKCSNDESAE